MADLHSIYAACPQMKTFKEVIISQKNRRQLKALVMEKIIGTYKNENIKFSEVTYFHVLSNSNRTMTRISGHVSIYY